MFSTAERIKKQVIMVLVKVNNHEKKYIRLDLLSQFITSTVKYSLVSVLVQFSNLC